VPSVRSCEKLPTCPMEPVLPSSKMDLPLAKAKPVSDGGSASVITYLKRAKICCAAAPEEKSESM